MSRKGRTNIVGGLLIAAAVVGAFSVRGCAATADTAGTAAAPAGVLSPADARAALERVALLGAVRAPKYERLAQFGKPWTDADHNGCDTRNDILSRDAARTGGHASTTGACKVTSLDMVEPYAGKHVTATSQVDIDHVVPLSVAWRSGAYTWSPEARMALANDP